MRLNVVVFRGPLLENAFKWVAQALERDVAGWGDTPEDALASLRRSIHGRHVVGAELGLDPMNLPPAPQRYWDMFRKAEPAAIDPSPEIEAARVVAAA